MEGQENIKLSRKEKKALRKQKRNDADRKGVLLLIILSVVAIALLFNAISAYNDDITVDDLITTTEGTTGEVTTTVPPTTQPPEITTQPSATDKEDTTVVPTQTVENNELSKADILQAVADGVNSLKGENATFSAVRTQNISLELQECSLPAFVSIVNKVMDFFEGKTVVNYSFTNGKGADPKTGEEITATGCIPPSNNFFTLTMDGVADATMRKEGENTVYSIVVVPETSTIDNPRPPYHKSAGDTFDCRNVPLPFGEITKADFDYPGATISVTVAPDGRVVRYHQILRIDGVGEGAAMGLTASGKILGEVDEVWDITY